LIKIYHFNDNKLLSSTCVKKRFNNISFGVLPQKGVTLLVQLRDNITLDRQQLSLFNFKASILAPNSSSVFRSLTGTFPMLSSSFHFHSLLFLPFLRQPCFLYAHHVFVFLSNLVTRCTFFLFFLWGCNFMSYMLINWLSLKLMIIGFVIFFLS